jgi:hypothetical protein
MKLKEFLGEVIENKANGQKNTCFKKRELKEAGISSDDLLNMNVDIKLFKEVKKYGFKGSKK